MRARILLLICVVLITVAVIMGATNYVRESKSARTTWEYKIPPGSWLSEDQLNELGAQGWELAGMTFDGSNTKFYLKRPK